VWDEMDAEERLWEWWRALDQAHRAAAMDARDALPSWMVDTLTAAGVTVVDANLTGHSPVALMPTYVRDFLERRAVAGDDHR